MSIIPHRDQDLVPTPPEATGETDEPEAEKPHEDLGHHGLVTEETKPDEALRHAHPLRPDEYFEKPDGPGDDRLL